MPDCFVPLSNPNPGLMLKCLMALAGVYVAWLKIAVSDDFVLGHCWRMCEISYLHVRMCASMCVMWSLRVLTAAAAAAAQSTRTQFIIIAHYWLPKLNKPKPETTSGIYTEEVRVATSWGFNSTSHYAVLICWKKPHTPENTFCRFRRRNTFRSLSSPLTRHTTWRLHQASAWPFRGKAS